MLLLVEEKLRLVFKITICYRRRKGRGQREHCHSVSRSNTGCKNKSTRSLRNQLDCLLQVIPSKLHTGPRVSFWKDYAWTSRPKQTLQHTELCSTLFFKSPLGAHAGWPGVPPLSSVLSWFRGCEEPNIFLYIMFKIKLLVLETKIKIEMTFNSWSKCSFNCLI